MTNHIKASDTDSLYIELLPVLNLMREKGIEITEENKTDILLKMAVKLQRGANDNLVTVSKDLFNINKKHFFELKQEMVLESAYWSGKRRYAMKISNKEGVTPKPEDAFVMMGLDLMKSNFQKLFRDFGKNTLISVLNKTPKKDIDKTIIDFRQHIKKIDWKNLLKPTGVKNIDEYVDQKPRKGEIFSKLAKKCPINTKACIYSNDLIKFKGVEAKHGLFKIGDKIFIAYLKDNPYKIDCVALNGYSDPQFLIDLVDKYIDRDRIFESSLENKLKGLYEDLNWQWVQMNQNFSKFFKYV